MRKGSSSVVSLLLAVGAGWLASNLWRNNTGGIRERVTEGSQRIRSEGERLWNRGAERLRWSGTRFNERMRGAKGYGEGPQESREYEDWRYHRPGESRERRPTDER